MELGEGREKGSDVQATTFLLRSRADGKDRLYTGGTRRRIDGLLSLSLSQGHLPIPTPAERRWRTESHMAGLGGDPLPLNKIHLWMAVGARADRQNGKVSRSSLFADFIRDGT